ncbi:ABC transporter permease [Sinisalibacter aestuarii]|uniref:Peptide ABC transporter permease n=1 Tax=Sinisalibacter aestuarii TaxID=2949426 RepID=A0ABQ5LQ86_9RHOB|nr:ABC transporter permease [Sinisalibacter aestuarii]GKY87169.1 peptide ABC transporter permease [Sinisalibacter aestuarii]
MRALDKKLLRDIRRLWAQSLAIAAVLAAGVMVMVTMNGALRSLSETRDTYYERARFADVWSSAARAPMSLVPEIAAIEGVARVEARITENAILDLADLDAPGMGQIISIPASGEPEMNRLILREGRLPEPGHKNEVVVSEAFALAHDFHPGDGFSITLNGQKRPLTITGIALSPEFIYSIGPGSIMPDDMRFGILWMPEDVLAAAFNLSGAFNSVTLGVTRGTDLEQVKDELETLLKPYGGTGPYDREQQTSNAFLDGEIMGLELMVQFLPPIFLLITAFLVNMVLSRLITLEREQIGLLKALGYSAWEVSWHYLKLAMLIGAVGIAIGWATGYWATIAIAEIYGEFFHFPYLVFIQYPAVYALSAVTGTGAALFGAVFAVRRVVQLSPAVAMSPPAPTRFRKGLFDRLIGVVKPRQTTMMILRAIGRWPLRAAMTTLGISMSAAMIVAALFMLDSFDELLDVAFVQVNRQDAILEFALPRPETVLDDVENLPGVMLAEGAYSAPARLYHGPRTRTVAIEGRRDGAELARVFDGVSRTEVPPEDGIVLEARLANHLDARVGDVIEVEFLQHDETRHRVILTGTVQTFFGLGAYMDQQKLSAMLGQEPQVYMANVMIDEGQEDALFKAVKDAPAISGITLMTTVRQSFDETMAESANISVIIYSFVASLIAVGVVYNSARIQLSERARELASLRILGFTRGEVSYILLGELFLLTAAAIPLGLWLGYILAAGMVESFDSDLYSIPLLITQETYIRAAGVVAGASIASALLVRRRIDRMDLVAVMKTRE